MRYFYKAIEILLLTATLIIASVIVSNAGDPFVGHWTALQFGQRADGATSCFQKFDVNKDGTFNLGNLCKEDSHVKGSLWWDDVSADWHGRWEKVDKGSYIAWYEEFPRCPYLVMTLPGGKVLYFIMMGTDPVCKTTHEAGWGVKRAFSVKVLDRIIELEY